MGIMTLPQAAFKSKKQAISAHTITHARETGNEKASFLHHFRKTGKGMSDY
jgi:hypothetical protein